MMALFMTKGNQNGVGRRQALNDRSFLRVASRGELDLFREGIKEAYGEDYDLRDAFESRSRQVTLAQRPEWPLALSRENVRCIQNVGVYPSVVS